MDIKQVQELVKIINKTNIAEISIEEEGLKQIPAERRKFTPMEIRTSAKNYIYDYLNNHKYIKVSSVESPEGEEIGSPRL